ncbi:MAG: DUF61 family protein [Candidatus Kariarchaeaceae archaeon]
MSGPFRRYLKHEIDTLNLHLPNEFKSLSSLLTDPSPCVLTRNGKSHSFIKSELTLLSQLLPSDLWSILQLPIQIIRRRDLGRGHFIISGSKLAFYVCLLLLDLEDRSYFVFSELDPPSKQTFTRLEVQILRRKLSSCSTIGFS